LTANLKPKSSKQCITRAQSRNSSQSIQRRQSRSKSIQTHKSINKTRNGAANKAELQKFTTANVKNIESSQTIQKFDNKKNISYNTDFFKKT